MEATQLRKGVLEGCVLVIISRGEIYGYDLLRTLDEHGFTVAGGTLYPLLAKLEKKGQITGIMQSSFEGPRRKYFHLTPAGENACAAFKQEWALLQKQVAALIAVADHQ